MALATIAVWVPCEQHARDRGVPEGVQAVDIGIEADALDDAADVAPVLAGRIGLVPRLAVLRNSSGALLGLPFAASFSSAASSGEIDTG